MSLLLNLYRRVLLWGLCGSSAVCLADNSFVPQGGEYPVAGLLAGDQVLPSIALSASGGYLTWQDNATDGDGLGVSARRIDSNFLGSLGVFRVNEQAAGCIFKPAA